MRRTLPLLAVLAILAGCSASEPTSEPSQAEHSSAPTFTSASELMDQLVGVAIECERSEDFDTTAGTNPSGISYPAPEGRRCTRPGGDVFVYVYEAADHRREAFDNGEVNVCWFTGEADAIDTVAGGNWRVASADPNVIFDDIFLTALNGEGAFENVSCLGVE